MASSEQATEPVTKPMVIQASRGGYRGFRSRQEFAWWNYAFKTRAIVIERPIFIGTLENFPQKSVFERHLGWIDYFRHEGTNCNLTLCREFLASLIPIPDVEWSWVAHVRGRTVLFNLAVISAIMGIPVLPENGYQFPLTNRANEPSEDQLATFLAGREMTWIGTQFDRNNLADRYKTLWLVVATAIDPTSHVQHLYPWHGMVIWAIANNMTFCLVRYIMGRIGRVYDTTAHNDTIKFGILITRICVGANVQERDTDERKIQRQPIDSHSQARAAGQLRNRPAAAAVPPVGATGAEEVGADTPGPSRRRRRTSTGPVNESSDPHMEFMRQQFEQMNTSMQEGFASVHERIDGLVTRQDRLETSTAASVRAQMEA